MFPMPGRPNEKDMKGNLYSFVFRNGQYEKLYTFSTNDAKERVLNLNIFQGQMYYTLKPSGQHDEGCIIYLKTYMKFTAEMDIEMTKYIKTNSINVLWKEQRLKLFKGFGKD